MRIKRSACSRKIAAACSFNAIVYSIGLLAFCLLDAAPAFATDTPIGDVLCNVAGWTAGNTGRAIETIAILIIGILAMMGKVSWGMAIIDAVGVALLFGAGQILVAMNAGATTACT